MRVRAVMTRSHVADCWRCHATSSNRVITQTVVLRSGITHYSRQPRRTNRNTIKHVTSFTGSESVHASQQATVHSAMCVTSSPASACSRQYAALARATCHVRAPDPATSLGHAGCAAAIDHARARVVCAWETDRARVVSSWAICHARAASVSVICRDRVASLSATDRVPLSLLLLLLTMPCCGVCATVCCQCSSL
jgi:hypothetical protein